MIQKVTPQQIQRTLAQARVFVKRGWTKGTCRRPHVIQRGDPVSMAYDIWGALEKACHITHVVPGAVLRAIGFIDQWHAMVWNDDLGRTWSDVMGRLSATPKELET